MLTASISRMEMVVSLLAVAEHVASVKLPTVLSLWIIGGIGLGLLQIATFAFQQIVGSVITGETWNLWQRFVRTHPSRDTIPLPRAELESLIRQGEQALAVIDNLRADNQYMLELVVGPKRARVIGRNRLAVVARCGSPRRAGISCRLQSPRFPKGK